MKKSSSASSLIVSAFAFLSALAWASPAHAQAVDTPSAGAQSYAKHCAICHGDQRQGDLPGFPPLLDIDRQLKPDQILQVIHHGKGRMPAFPKLPEAETAELLRFLETDSISTPASASSGSSSLAEAGGHLFQRNCAFCHGRDAGGGEVGPDLTRSKLALSDVDGDKIGEVVRNGRPEKKMPAFNFNNEEIRSLAAFIHLQQKKAASRPGGRKGVDVSDLQTGNVAAGKAYFYGPGGCSKCHSPTGDLAGVATRYEGLQLERRMLYPEDAVSKVTVTLASGQKLTGTLAYRDEFVIGMRDGDGVYHSWPVHSIHFTVDSPVDAHVELFSKYTDDDIHNLMAYIQTMK